MSSSEGTTKACFLRPKRKKILKKFAETTSAHGCVLVSRSRNTCKRIVWILVVSAVWFFCAFQVFVAIYKYLHWPTTVSVQIRHMTNIRFPAVTICNLNPIRSDWIRDHPEYSMAELTFGRGIHKQEKTQGLSAEEWQRKVDYSRRAAHLTKETDAIYKHLIAMYNGKVNMSEAGLDISTMLLDCTFQSVNCTAANFTRWEHGSYGNCYTMVVVGDHHSNFVGPLYGLSLTLFTHDSQYLARHSQGSGFQVEVHPPEYIPFPEDKGFTISPGVLTSVGVKLMRISRMPWPYDGTHCGDLNNQSSSTRHARVLQKFGYTRSVNYTTQACVKSCYQRRLIKDCGCVDPSFTTRADVLSEHPANNTIVACDIRSVGGQKCLRQSMANTTAGRYCEDVCPQSCHEQGYVTRLATALWPRESYYRMTKDSWQQAHPSLKTTLDAADARLNVLKLEVYFEELNYESVVESAAMDIWDVLSNIGGTLGLYVGVSFLTFGEFLELFLECLALPARERLMQRAASKQLL